MRFILLFLFFISLGSSATTLPELTYDQLVSYSDVVVVGKIVSARYGGTKDARCSAIYQIEIERTVAGKYTAGQTITVGPYVGLMFGNRYLFFLDKTKTAEKLIASTNSEMLSDEAAWEEKCKNAEKPEFSVVMEGVAALEITDNYDTEEVSSTVHFPPQWITPPKRVVVTEDEYQKSTWGKDRLVDLDKLLQ